MLAGCNIESVTIKADKNVFSDGNLTIRAAKLPEYNDEKEWAENREELDKSLRVENSDDCVLHTDFTNTVTTNVKAGVYTVGSNNASIYTLLVPATAELNENNFNIIVTLDNGYFEVTYKSEAEIEAEEDEVIKQAMKANNIAIKSIVDAYDEGGALTSIYRNEEGKTVVMGVNVALYDAAWHLWLSA